MSFLKNKQNLRDMWDNIKSANICVIGSQEGENDNGAEKICI